MMKESRNGLDRFLLDKFVIGKEALGLIWKLILLGEGD
jgi:hypothetical protein